ncbi:hypothetical protein GCM10023189_20120 [Nibrella saemangeumensis]|uniref:SnoaL-like domain-containing protein n=1 Tax=Nibrella saemangeumensis TaxID=1084526 RepID=A0ABP8MS52_9BACT
MKKTFIACCVLLLSHSIQAQSFKAADVEAVDQQIYDALRARDLNAFFKNMATDAVIYGTDPADRWPMDVFRKRVEEDFKSNRLNLDVKTLSREVMPLAGGRVAVVTKQTQWPFAKAPVREVAVYENTNGWKLKNMSLALLLPDQQLPALNQLVTSASAGNVSTAGAASMPRAGQNQPMAIWINYVKPDRKQQFEQYIERFWQVCDQALQAGKMPKQEADACRQVRVQYPSKPNADGTLSYIFMADPYDPANNYEMGHYMRFGLPEEEAKKLEKLYDDAQARPQEGLYVQQKKY